MTIELLTSLDTFHDLHVVADTRRASVKVDSTALRHLLIDHSCMLNELRRHGVQASAPPPPRRREKVAV
jgi:hypothetical protein